MSEECSKCGEKIIENSAFCPKCGAALNPTSQIERKYARFSTASLIMGCIAIGLFSWLIIIWPYWVGSGGPTLALIVSLLILISNSTSVVLGAVSVKKGLRVRAILGVIFGSIGTIYHVIALKIGRAHV